MIGGRTGWTLAGRSSNWSRTNRRDWSSAGRDGAGGKAVTVPVLVGETIYQFLQRGEFSLIDKIELNHKVDEVFERRI